MLVLSIATGAVNVLVNMTTTFQLVGGEKSQHQPFISCKTAKKSTSTEDIRITMFSKNIVNNTGDLLAAMKRTTENKTLLKQSREIMSI